MMEYEIFKGVVEEKFKEFLPEEYKNAKIEKRQVNKVNSKWDGLSVISDESGISPTIYVNQMYEDYMETGNMNETLDRAAKVCVKAMEDKKSINVQDCFDADYAKENIVFQLINTEQNKEMLANMPSFTFKDLSVIYRMVVKVNERGIESAPINNGLAKKLGFTEEQLFQLAAENTKRIFPPVIKTMNEIMRELFMKEDGMVEEMVDMMLDEIPKEQQMYVISNNHGVNGAVSMLYEDVLHNLAEKLDSDLYILPSSIHEVIAVGTSMGDPDELASMVAEINMDQVKIEERLSNQVYLYDKDLRKVSLATDTPNKRLDGIGA